MLAVKREFKSRSSWRGTLTRPVTANQLFIFLWKSTQEAIRGGPAKTVGWLCTGARVRIPPLPPRLYKEPSLNSRGQTGTTPKSRHSLASITQLVEYFLGKEEVVRSSRIGSSRPILYCLNRAGTIQWPHRRTRDGGDAFSNRNHLMETNSGTPSRRLVSAQSLWMVGPIAMLYNIGQVMILKREDKIKPWHSLKTQTRWWQFGADFGSHQRWRYSSLQAACTSTSKCPKGQIWLRLPKRKLWPVSYKSLGFHWFST